MAHAPRKMATQHDRLTAVFNVRDRSWSRWSSIGYSITSSARGSSDRGIVSPSALRRLSSYALALRWLLHGASRAYRLELSIIWVVPSYRFLAECTVLAA